MHFSQGDADYVNEVRMTLLESYTSIIQALGEEKKATALMAAWKNQLDPLMVLFENIANELDETSPEIFSYSAALIGDFASYLGPQVATILGNRGAVKKILDELEDVSKSQPQSTFYKNWEWAFEQLTRT